jgi:hypothetical protein
MKRKLIYSLVGLSLALGSCSDYLNVNENPNSATSATPALVMPQALTASGGLASTFNNYGAALGGFQANAGGFAGFGSFISYNYTSSDYAGLWSLSYSNLKDYEYVFQQTTEARNAYYHAAARTMKVFVYQKLVDTYNDVPYSDAVRGSNSIAPKYDKASDIYKALILQCDTAIAEITVAQAAAVSPLALTPETDPLFKGDVNKWKRFANTLKLSLLIRGQNSTDLTAAVNAGFTSFNTTVGVITDDALVNPGYRKEDNRQNPIWNTYAYPATSTAVTGTGRSRIATRWILSFYTGSKLADAARASVIYRNGANITQVNQLGNEVGVPNAPTGFPVWFTGATVTTESLGVLKGPSQGMPLMLAAEAQFLLAEAKLIGKVTGLAKINFDAGIVASFNYLYKNSSDVLQSGKTPGPDAIAYQVANATSYLVNYDLALTTAQRLEAIITQKYIAVNMLNSDAAWNEYRRTGYPTIVNGSSNALLTFASLVSASTAANKLPSRVLYPTTEFSYNPGNVPSGVSAFTTKVFWAR